MSTLRYLVLGASLTLSLSSVQAAEGVIVLESQRNVVATADRLERALLEKGMTVFKRVDHSAGAAKVGQTLRPTQLLIFGNPKVGTPLMNCAQSVALDLPQKALIYEDQQGKVWLSYNDPMYLKKRHGLEGCDEALKKVSGALSKFAQAATQ